MSVDDLVEKVASSMWNDVHWLPVMPMFAHEVGWRDEWPADKEAFRELFRAQARSAILAVLEGISKPTQAMHEAAHDALDSRQDHSGCDIYVTWPAMIDALRASVEKEDV